jgi:hypothetical protein
MRRILFAFFLLLPSAVPAEIVRTLTANLEGPPAVFRVENLLGILTVVPGPPGRITAVATIHAESEELASGMAWEKRGAILHLRYPLDRVGRLRYPRLDEEIPDWLPTFASSTRVEYQGRTARIHRRGGSLLYADVEIRVPPGAAGEIDERVGRIDARGLEGKFLFSSATADMRLESLRGEVRVRARSSDVNASDIHGKWSSEATSADCALDGFDGDSVELSAHSGDVRLHRVSADRVSVETHSGDIRVADADLREFSGRAGSGDVALDNRGSRLASVRVNTASGDISLRLPADTAFSAQATHGSGDVTVDFRDVTSRVEGSTASYQHGNGGARISVEVGSGDVSIRPR